MSSSEQQRKVPMEVLCLGLCRTGTQTVADTLEMLGYGSIYHMREVIKNGHSDFWVKSIHAHKANDTANLPSRADFDHILGEFNGVADIPAAVLVPELLDAYPDAAVLLSTRDPDAWVRSMHSSILHGWNDTSRPKNPKSEAIGEVTQALWDHDFDANGVSFFHAHNQSVKDEAAKRGRKVLEIDVSQPEAFAALCAFLDKKPPNGMNEFPVKDAWITYKKKHGIGGYAKESEDTDDKLGI